MNGLDAAETARLDAIGQRWAEIGRAVIAQSTPADAASGLPFPFSITRPAVSLSTAAPRTGLRLPSAQEGSDEHH